MLRVLLEGERYKVLWSRTGEDGLAQALEARPDVVILELDLPDGDGFAVLDALREWSAEPVLILSGRVGVADKVRALDAGANDYLVKPFSPEELTARLRVLLRCELPTNDGPFLVNGPLKIDMATHKVTVNDRAPELTATEEAVLYVLARHVGRFIPRRRLIRSIWGVDAADKIHHLQVHIGQLRRKLEDCGGPHLIRGEGGLGYSLVLVPDPICTDPQTAV